MTANFMSDDKALGKAFRELADARRAIAVQELKIDLMLDQLTEVADYLKAKVEDKTEPDINLPAFPTPEEMTEALKVLDTAKARAAKRTRQLEVFTGTVQEQGDDHPIHAGNKDR